MPFPDHIERVFDAYGVPADTKAALFDLYIALGADVLEVFGDIADGVGSPAILRPEDTVTIRAQVIERYVRKNHPRWLEGTPTPSLWHPRLMEGRAAGLAMPLGPISDVARAVVGPDQPLPDGFVMHGRNAHYGGRQDTVSFDVVARELEDALAIAQAAGQQHTMPGSVGATSGTFDAINSVALIWEIQPNVYKPADDRNREIAKVYRRHRNWHLITLTAALEWLRTQSVASFILRGSALATTHEVNPAKPVSATIAEHHDRTVVRVAEALGHTLTPASTDDEQLLVNSEVMNHALRQHVVQHGVGGTLWRLSESRI
jgi:hypothetical protein